MRIAWLAACTALGLSNPITAIAGTIQVTSGGASTPGTCTLAQAIDLANRAHNGAGSWGATPPGTTTVDPLRHSVVRTIGSGTCTGATSGSNTISLQAFAGQTLMFHADATMYPSQGWNDAVADRADNYWYGPNALPPIASPIVIDGHGVTLRIADGTRRLRFFFIGADARPDNVNAVGEPRTPGYNTPGAGDLTLRRLTLQDGRQLGGTGDTGAGGGAGLGGAIYNQNRLTLEAVTLLGNRAQGGRAFQTPAQIHKGGGGLGADAGIDEAGGMGGPVPNGSGDPGLDGGCLICGHGGGTDNAFGGFGAWDEEYVYSSGGNGSGGGGYMDAQHNGGGGAGFRGGIGGRGADGSSWYPSGGAFGHGGLTMGGGGVGGGGKGGGVLYGASGGFGGGAGTLLTWGGTPGFGGGAPDSRDIAFGGGEGIRTYAGGGGGMGGAVFNHFGHVTILASTLTGNQAIGGQGEPDPDGTLGFGRGLGGAVFNLNGTLDIRHATLAGNAVYGWAPDGGAVYSLGYNGEDLPASDPGFTGSHTAQMVLHNSVLAGSHNAHDGSPVRDLVSHRPDTVVSRPIRDNHALLMVEQSGSLVQAAQAIGFHAIYDDSWLSVDPQLQPLSANGGPTLTLLPLAGSPLIDGAAASSCTGQLDQRGAARPAGPGCDIGAVEVIAPIVVTTSVDESIDNGACSLREALNNVNGANHPDCGARSPFGTLVRFAAQVDTVLLTQGVAGIFGDVTVDGDRDGDGMPDVTIDAGNASAHFLLGNSKTIALNGLNLIGGNAGAQAGGALRIQDADNVITLSNSRIAGARSTGNGGAIDVPLQNQLIVRHSVFESNQAGGNGGAIHNMGLMTIIDSRFIGNQANDGGAIHNGLAATVEDSTVQDNGASGHGGGVHNQGFLDVARSTLAGNQANGSGGALYNSVSTTLDNVTLSGNSAAINGGGVLVTATSVVELRQATLAGNTAGSGSAVHSSGTLRMARSLVDGAGPANCVGTITGSDNLAWGDATCTGMSTGDPVLQPLADNGGPTWTHRPGASSAAVDVLDCDGPLRSDQRGIERPQGFRCDIGALETAAVHTVGGALDGLLGGSVQLHLQPGNQTLTLDANGDFVFEQPVTEGADYLVTLIAQPQMPAQWCTLTNDAGTVANGPVADVGVICVLDDTLFANGFE